MINMNVRSSIHCAIAGNTVDGIPVGDSEFKHVICYESECNEESSSYKTGVLPLDVTAK